VGLEKCEETRGRPHVFFCNIYFGRWAFFQREITASASLSGAPLIFRRASAAKFAGDSDIYLHTRGRNGKAQVKLNISPLEVVAVTEALFKKKKPPGQAFPKSPTSLRLTISPPFHIILHFPTAPYLFPSSRIWL
jgi:hypothetical protein